MLLAILLSASIGSRVAARADQFIGSHEPKDCSSFVTQVYRREGVPLEGNVRLLHAKARRARALKRKPGKGDLVFFRNTYDKNRDGSLADGLTHVGIVDEIQPNGTITFVHRAGKGVTRSAVDPGHRHVHKDAHGRLRNDFIRRQPPALTGELLVDFADAAKLTASVP